MADTLANVTFANQTDLPQYSVVIPAYNAESTLNACLAALTSQSVDLGKYEITVVDDGSTDRTAAIAETFDVNILRQTNQGPAAARNQGAFKARGRILLFTDADCVPEHHWLEEMVKPLEADPAVTAVKGAYKTNQRSIAARFAQAEFEDRYDLLETHAFIDMIDTYAAAIRTHVFREMGGFDPKFPIANNEDTDLSYRMAAAGHKLVFNRRAIVRHTHPATLRKYLCIKFWRGYWRVVVYRRYPEKAIKDSYTPTVIKIQTLLMAGSFPFLALAVIYPGFLLPALAAFAGVLASALPFSLKAFKRDPLAGLAAPGIVFLRSVVFAAGSLAGGIRSLFF